MVKTFVIFLILCDIAFADVETWRGLVVAPEERCSEYKPEDYTHPPWLEEVIIFGMGGRIYGPYTRTNFTSPGETEIDHLIAKSEAHDSGLCKASRKTRRLFASDPRNLILAATATNRHKGDKDASAWLPPQNQCWFAQTTLRVRRAYGLTIDTEEADVLEQILSECASFKMVLRAIETT